MYKKSNWFPIGTEIFLSVVTSPYRYLEIFTYGKAAGAWNWLPTTI